MEPSSDGKLDFDSAKTAARLVLAISASLSHQKRREIFSIPPVVFSYAVTMLGGISCGLADVMDQNTLLAYLSYCSRSTLVSADDVVLPVVEEDLVIDCPLGVELLQRCWPAEPLSQGAPELSKIASPHPENQLEVYNEANNYTKLILSKTGQLWPLVKLGCIGEVLRTLRSWKEGLATFHTDSLQSEGGKMFSLQYLRVVKLLVKVWSDFMVPRSFFSNGVGDLGLIFGKLDRKLREIRYRYTGLTKEEELHVLELILVTYALRLSNVGACGHESTLKKLYSTMSRVEFLHKDGSIEPSDFVIELKKTLHRNGTPIGVDDYCPFLFEELLEFFSLKQFVFCGELKHVKAELNVKDNDWINPLPFIPGLPAGIPLLIKLCNTLSETKLWLRMTLANELTEFVFVDLKQLAGSDEIREFTFIASFYGTPRTTSFTLRVCIGMECLGEDVHSFRVRSGPKRELVYLCKEKEVYLSMPVK